MTTTDTAPQAPHQTTAQARTVVDIAVKACEAYDRADLRARLLQAREQLEDRGVHVVVVGEFKQGKSSLVNALLNAEVCPVDDDIATGVPTFLRFGEQPRAQVSVISATDDGDDPPDPVSHEIAIEDVRGFVMEHRGVAGKKVDAVEIWLGRRLLEGGMVLVDTPGVGGLGSPHAAATMAALPLADAVVFVTDASQEFTATELAFLRQAHAVCPRLVVAVTKTDFYPAWRKIIDIDRGHLRAHGLDVPVINLAAPLRMVASRTSDRELNQESGYPRLVSYLRDQVAARAASDAVFNAGADVLAAVDQIESQFQAERAAIADPAVAESVVEELKATRTRTEALRGRAAKWSQTLTDGIADLVPHIEHDYRNRTRQLLKECDDAIDNSDPADTWTEFEPWLSSRVSHEVLENYTEMRNRAAELSELVEDHFREASGEILDDLAVYNPVPMVGGATVETKVDLEKMGLGATGFQILRGSYMGILMFSMVGSMVGIALGPVAIGIGLIMGRKSLKEERDRQRNNRRIQAKNAVRKYTDEVTFVVNKDTRDTLRRVQRQMRDHYAARAEELHRSTSDALNAATEAAKRSEADRTSRLRDLEAELERLHNLRARARTLHPALGD
jgi:hypothetical protein